MGNEKKREHAESAPRVSPRMEVFVARQPIYDSAMATIAYELLYRRSPVAVRAEVTDPGRATLQVIRNAALEIGLDRLASGLPIHLNYPKELLATVPELPVRSDSVVIEVLEDVRADPEVLEGIRTLRARGHRIALNNYSPQTSDPKLLEFCDVVKIHAEDPAADEFIRTVKQLKTTRLKLIAEHVETREQFEHCIALGFDGFQGHFLQHPQTFRAKRASSNRLAALRLIASLHSKECSVDEVERLLSRDVSMSSHVLRCINSSYYNLPLKVDSIRQAIGIVGLEDLRQLCALLSLQGFEDRPSSLLVLALTRARMCEQLGRLGGVKDSGPFFITGLFSLLNAILGLSTERIVENLPLTPAISRALIAGEGTLGKALQCTRAYERAAWSQVVYGDLPPNIIRAAYVDALFWAEKARQLLPT